MMASPLLTSPAFGQLNTFSDSSLDTAIDASQIRAGISTSGY
jgi:hypothetical protein